MRYYFPIIGLLFLLLTFLHNEYSIDQVLILYIAITLVCLVLRTNRSYGVIISNTVFAFVVLQVFASGALFDVDFKTLQPNLSIRIEIDTGLLRGLDEEIFISTDDRGFRSLHSKIEYDKKLYLVGGSTMEQLLISDDTTTASILENMLVGVGQTINVVNTGLSGTRAVHHAATIRNTEGDDTVGYIILVGVNDWNNALRSGKLYWKLKSIIPRKPTDWPLTRVVRGLRNIVAGKESRTAAHERVMGAPNAYYQRVMNFYKEKPKVNFEITVDQKKYYSEEIRKIEDACENLQAERFCVFVSQPHGYYAPNFENEEYVSTLWMTPPNEDWALTPASLISIANA